MTLNDQATKKQTALSILVDTFDYIRLGTRELIKFKNETAIYLLLSIIVCFVIGEASKTLSSAHSSWGIFYSGISGMIIATCTSVYFTQELMGRYRSISIKKTKLFLCFIGFFLAQQVLPAQLSYPAQILTDRLFFPLLTPERTPTPAFFFIVNSGIYHTVEYFVRAVLAALIAAPLSFYPMLVLKESKSPLKEGWVLIKKRYASITLMLAVYFFLDKIVTHSLSYVVAHMMHPKSIYNGIVIGAALVNFLSIVFSIFLAAILVSAYLRETNETDFARKQVIARLF